MTRCPACGNRDIRPHETYCWICMRPLNAVADLADRRAARMVRAASADRPAGGVGVWSWATVRLAIILVVAGVMTGSFWFGLVVGAVMAFVIVSARRRPRTGESAHEVQSPVSSLGEVVKLLVAAVGMVLLFAVGLVFVLFMVCLAMVGGHGGFH
jgi:hypothetical protein